MTRKMKQTYVECNELKEISIRKTCLVFVSRNFYFCQGQSWYPNYILSYQEHFCAIMNGTDSMNTQRVFYSKYCGKSMQLPAFINSKCFQLQVQYPTISTSAVREIRAQSTSIKNKPRFEVRKKKNTTQSWTCLVSSVQFSFETLDRTRNRLNFLPQVSNKNAYYFSPGDPSLNKPSQGGFLTRQVSQFTLLIEVKEYFRRSSL